MCEEVDGSFFRLYETFQDEFRGDGMQPVSPSFSVSENPSYQHSVYSDALIIHPEIG